MAWYEGTIPNTGSGILLSIFDNILTQNQNWSIYDNAAGTNKKVYRNNCPAKNSLFYLEVDNNYSGYALVRLWEGWNAETHVGVGASTTQGRINFSAQGYGIALNDTRFIFCLKASGLAFYFGQLKRFVSLNMPALVALDVSYSGIIYNPLGALAIYTNYLIFRFLFGSAGNNNVTFDLYNRGYNDTLCLKIPNGMVLLEESPIREIAVNKLIGRYDGAIVAGWNTAEFANLDIVWEGDIGWLALKASSGCCLVKMA